MFFYVNDVKLRCFFDSFGVPMNLVFLVSFGCSVVSFRVRMNLGGCRQTSDYILLLLIP